MIRTFVAIELPPAIQAALGEFTRVLQRSQAPVSWVKSDRIHLTLKFLGEVLDDQIPAICEVLGTVAETAEPFRLQPIACGAFPTIKQMRVVWVGIQGEIEPLRALQARAEEGLSALGFQPEGRPFRAHLTLGRVKGRQRLRVLQEALLANQNFSAEAFDVTELVLYKSELRPEGARYTPLCRAVLHGGRAK